MEVWLYWLGCWKALTHWRDPTTARHGNFWLLGFPPGPFRSSLGQPGPSGLLQTAHVDARLSTDTCSTQVTIQQDSHPQASHSIKPPSSRITGMRHIPGGNTHGIFEFVEKSFRQVVNRCTISSGKSHIWAILSLFEATDQRIWVFLREFQRQSFRYIHYYLLSR